MSADTQWAATRPQSQLVTIGIPTHNRVDLLRRAVASALSQDHQHLEIIISDNASTDATRSFCEDLVAVDQRVRYMRSETNLGATANFENVLRTAGGDAFMWLGDDDWLDRSYVSTCLEALVRDSRVQLVAGHTLYHRGTQVFSGETINIEDTHPCHRVLAYYRSVRGNGVFYGLCRTDVLKQLLPLQNRFAADWFVVAFLASRGLVRTLTTTELHRCVGGATSRGRETLRACGLGPFRSHLPFASLVPAVGLEAMSVRYRNLGLWHQLSLALRSQLVVTRTHLIGRHFSPIRQRISLAWSGLPGSQ